MKKISISKATYISNLCTSHSWSIRGSILPWSAKIFQIFILKENTEAVQRKNTASNLKIDNLK